MKSSVPLSLSFFFFIVYLSYETTEEEMLPPFDFRLTTTKLLIEAEMESQAVSIVDQLLCEDDSHLELLYLAAIVMLKSGEPEVASEHIARAMQVEIYIVALFYKSVFFVKKKKKCGCINMTYERAPPPKKNVMFNICGSSIFYYFYSIDSI